MKEQGNDDAKESRQIFMAENEIQQRKRTTVEDHNRMAENNIKE
jgi:hypothetical protein